MPSSRAAPLPPPPFTEGSPYYSPDVDDVGFDLERSRELLAEAGYPDGFSFTVPTVEPLRRFNEAVRGSLANAGIDMNIETVQIGTMAGEIREGRWVGRITVARALAPNPFYVEELASTAPMNAFGNDRSELDALAEEALTAADESAAAAKWAEVYANAIENGQIITVVHIVTGSVVADHVTGAQMPPGSFIPNPRNIRVDGNE